jgi:hypothetical protein
MSWHDLFKNFRPEVAWMTIEVDGKSLRVLDCRKFVLGRFAWTADEKMAASFARARIWDGGELEGQLPRESVTIETTVHLPNTGGGRLPDGKLFQARQMEDKYDVFNFGTSLYICRSWTSELVLRAEYSYADRLLNCHVIHAAPDLGESPFVQRFMEYVVKSHCLDMICPHPIWPLVRRRKSEIAAYSFSQFGRRAWYASYDETIGIYSPAKYSFPAYDTALQKMSNEQRKILAGKLKSDRNT